MLPAFPRTPHIPHQVNATDDDAIASAADIVPVFTDSINVEEKIDGASVGMMIHDGHPIIRNREHILRKGFEKDTAAKKQFAPIWNWFYDNIKSFELLSEMGAYSVYGEWCLAQHGIFYDKLPSFFIAYDIYDYEKNIFLPPSKARVWLTDLGFTSPPLIHQGKFDGGFEELAAWASRPSPWSSHDMSEGIYIKAYNEFRVTDRFKMVDPNYVRGKYWNAKKLTKNKLAK